MPMMRSLLWSCLASARPRLPLMPVTTIAGLMESPSWKVAPRSPEDAPAFLESLVDHALDGGLHGAHLLVQLGVLVIRAAGEVQRISEVEAVLGGQREGQPGGRDGKGRE